MAYRAVRSRPDFGPCRMHIASGRRGDPVGCSREDRHTVGCRSAVGAVGIGNRDRLDSFAKQNHTAEFAALVAETNGQHQTHAQLARRGAREDADRAAIEAQWVRFWVIYDSIVRTPKESRPGELRKVAVQPLIKAILKAAVDADSKGIDNYGTWKHRVSWQFPVKGASTAVIADCQDQSKTGTYVVKSGQILTVGKERSNMRGEFLKGTDGVWRLRQIYVIGDQKC